MPPRADAHQGSDRSSRPDGAHAIDHELDRQRRQGQEVIARQRRIRRIEQVRAQQQRQHQGAEQAGPALLEAEQQEFISPRAPAGTRRKRFQLRADRGYK